MTADRVSGRILAKRWNLDVAHALYRKSGDWYHRLERFPGALLDDDGYVVFATEHSFRHCPQLHIRQDVHVPGGIKPIPGYTRAPTTESGRSRHVTQSGPGRSREGAKFDVILSKAERSAKARQLCLATHGYACQVCKIEFEHQYGPIGTGFIHVHHVQPLSGGERMVDPVTDLVPLCPNCHAMVHRQDPPLSVDELRSLLQAHRGRLTTEQ